MKNWILTALCSTALLSVVNCSDDKDEGSSDTNSNVDTGAGPQCDADACNACLGQLDPMNPIPPMCDSECEGCEADTSTPADTGDSSPGVDTGASGDSGDIGDFGKPCTDKPPPPGQSDDCMAPTNCIPFGGPDYCTTTCDATDDCPHGFVCGSVGASSETYCKPEG